jgi:hypothetical protein
MVSDAVMLVVVEVRVTPEKVEVVHAVCKHETNTLYTV